MNTKLILLAIALIFGFWSCNSNAGIKLLVNNSLDVDRNAESVEVSLADLGLTEDCDLTSLVVVDGVTGKVILSQWVDNNQDGTPDALIFQPEIPANTSKTFFLKKAVADSVPLQVYSRFVPERTDDYTWENDKVAFRTYGPTAQKMAEEGNKEGTLSSGLDCWLKRVDYLIIDKWYKKYTEGTGTYHEDTGEGLDCYHVGASRGCGGIGVWLGDSLSVSKNFTAWKTFGEGPVRVGFNLEYANWMAGDKTISEQKRISLDLGAQLMKVEDRISGTDTITIGITLHENTGTTNVDTTAGWFRYWEPMGDSEMGEAVVINPEYFAGYKKVASEVADHSQLFVNVKVIDGKATYYTGFAWKKAGEITTPEEWDSYLSAFAKKLKSPLTVQVLK